jgi:hypothetical protein
MGSDMKAPLKTLSLWKRGAWKRSLWKWSLWKRDLRLSDLREKNAALRVMAAVVCLSFGAVALLPSPPGASDAGLPEKLPINLDASYARWVGTTADGSQFLFSNASLTEGATRRYFTTFYMFDGNGRLIRSEIEEIREGTDKVTALAALEKVKALRERHLKEIGPVRYANISVRPFQVSYAGTAFGLIAEEATGQPPQISLQPGRILTFRAPWNGKYRN